MQYGILRVILFGRKDWLRPDAAGLPMLPLMVRYDEIQAGEINHAIRITVPHTQNTYIWPARAQAGVANTAYPPMGQRFRLKASFDISGFSPTNQIILKAMKKYGMILADNGWDNDNRKWWISGVRDDRWNTGDLWDLTSVKGTDFEAVDVSSLMIDSNSGKARVTPTITPTPIPTPTPAPSITVTSPNGGESWDRSVSQTLTWSYTGNPGSTVKIVLLKGTTTIGTIADNVPIGSSGKGSYVWPGWTGRIPGSDYKVSVQSTSQPSISDISNDYFTVTGVTTPIPTPIPTTIPIPVANEQMKVGIYNDGIWYLDINRNGIFDTTTENPYNFGGPGWTSVLGDWNGDSKTDIGVYQNGVWYLDYNSNGAWEAGTDKVYNFGGPGWTSVLGDWNGDSKTDIGVYQNGVWYLDYNSNGAWETGT